MLTCIACSKQQLVDAGDQDAGRGTATSTKPAVKSLTSQIKDVVLKLTGAHRQGKPGYHSSSRLYQKAHRSYGVMDYDYASEGGGDDGGGSSTNGGGGGHGEHYPHLVGRGGSSSSTPAWDFARVSEHEKASRFEAWDMPVMLEEVDHEPKEWVAQVEPGVHITFLSLPHGGNDLKRIRFDRELFNKWQAQRWWGENYDRIMELYNVQRFNRQALSNPPRSEDERESNYSRLGSRRESPAAPFGNASGITATFSSSSNNNDRAPMATGAVSGTGVFYPAPYPTEYFFPQYQQAYNHGWGASCKGEAPLSMEARTTTSSRDEASVSISNASDIMEATEWVEEDEPGVYVTIRKLADGTRDLRRVRFSRERFGEVNAKLWWEENRERIHAQYL